VPELDVPERHLRKLSPLQADPHHGPSLGGLPLRLDLAGRHPARLWLAGRRARLWLAGLLARLWLAGLLARLWLAHALEDPADRGLTIGERLAQHELDEVTGKAGVVRRVEEGTLDAGGGYFQGVRGLDQVGDIEGVRQGARDVRAQIERHPGAWIKEGFPQLGDVAGRLRVGVLHGQPQHPARTLPLERDLDHRRLVRRKDGHNGAFEGIEIEGWVGGGQSRH
jgi:hypothetical protein